MGPAIIRRYPYRCWCGAGPRKFDVVPWNSRSNGSRMVANEGDHNKESEPTQPSREARNKVGFSFRWLCPLGRLWLASLFIDALRIGLLVRRRRFGFGRLRWLWRIAGTRLGALWARFAVRRYKVVAVDPTLAQRASKGSHGCLGFIGRAGRIERTAQQHVFLLCDLHDRSLYMMT